MSPYQFIVFSLFIGTCIIVTYMNSRRMLGLRRQRDSLAAALLDVMNEVNWTYPEGIHSTAPSMVAARKAIQGVLRSEKEKNS